MNRISRLITLSLIALTAIAGYAENLVILHTNDTHSTIEPDENGRGGVLQRKAIIDSVRRVEKNVILVDAGDAVQGSLYFKFFRGDVEYPLMDMLGYDIRLLGNHEFDNGMDELTKYYSKLKGKAISANYDFSETELAGVFSPYIIKKVAGKKIGFIGLNVDPTSLIAKDNIKGVKFLDIIETANRTAEYLKQKKHCDIVVAVTHIGYTTKHEGKVTDVDLAQASRDIDIIIGGHSHTTVTPGRAGKFSSLVDNAVGRPVLITQTGKYGPNLGYIKIDLDALKQGVAPSGESFEYKLIPVTDRFPQSMLDRKIINFLKPYQHIVDSINANVIAYAPRFLDSDSATGEYANWTADFAYRAVQNTLDSINGIAIGNTPESVDLAIMNVGGIRMNQPVGDVTEGRILSTFPFSNRLVVLELKGSDLIETMRAAARRHGEAVSENVRVVIGQDWSLKNVLVDGCPVDPNKMYRVATIDYLADGNDDLKALANGRVIWTDPRDVSIPILQYIRRQTSFGLPMSANPDSRFVQQVVLDAK